MAHYAIINEQNTVIQVITGVDEETIQTDIDGTKVGGSTEAWELFYTNQLNNPNLYVKRCSYNGKMRAKYPAINDLYDFANDKFVAPLSFEPIEL